MRVAVLLLSLLVAVLAGLNVYQYRAKPADVASGQGPVPFSPPPEPQPESRQLTQDEVVAGFYEHWAPLNKPTVWKNKWFGISTLQNPMDVWITQEILFEVRPDFVVEAGTYHGGSAAMLATVLEQINPRGRIITIDIEDMAAEAKKLPIVQRKVDFIIGSSTDPKVVSDVTRRVAGGKVLVILDSVHTKAHVLAELKAYAPLVSVGSYLIVQDTFVNGHPALPDYGPGPWEAVHAFLKTTKDFQIDKSRERLLITLSPDGFLKRIR